MKKLFCLLFFCLLFSIISSAQVITIKGKITDTDTVMILFRSINNTDTVFTTNGKFMYSKKLSSPEFFTIVWVKNKQSIQALTEGNERKMRSLDDGASRELFLESGELSINTNFANLRNIKLALVNHTMQDKYEEFRKRFNPLVKMARTIIDSSYTYNKTETEKKAFAMLMGRVIQVENEVAEKFVLENSTNAAGAYVLYRYCRIEDHRKLDSLYKLFNATLQATTYLKNIRDKIKSLTALIPGKTVPIFTTVTSDKKAFNLSDLKGQYVVLDFWGSWCMPCTKGFPKMKEYYRKYSNRIAFVGIACNDKESDWKDAISKYELGWLHVFNPEGADNLAVKYNVEAYPTKILIDRDGNFIQAFKGEGEDFYQKLDALIAIP